MLIESLNHVALRVTDVPRSVAFYRDVLRLEVMERPGFSFPGAWLRVRGEQELHLIGGTTRDATGGSRGNHFALRVDDIAGWAEHLRQCGVAFRGPHRRPDAVQQIFVEDPDGHVVELCSGV